METEMYYFRGLVESINRRYWLNGYSRTGENGEIEYPWLPKKECQKISKRYGKRAVFEK